jgi:hypothetical protein
MPRLTNKEIKGIAPDVIRLLVKIIRLSKGGLSKAERREIGEDLLVVALNILEDAILVDDTPGNP